MRTLKNAGFEYNSSLNPAFIPGRYIHLNTPRTYFMRKGVMEIPASVTQLSVFQAVLASITQSTRKDILLAYQQSSKT